MIIFSALPLPDPNVITRAIIEGALSQHEYQRQPKIEGKINAYSTFQDRSNSDKERAVPEQARKLFNFFKPTYAVYPIKPVDTGTNGYLPNKVSDNLHTSSSTSASSVVSTNISSSQIGTNVSGGISSTVSSTPVLANAHVVSNGNQVNKPGIAAGFFHNFLSAFNSDNKRPAGTVGLTGFLANAVSGLGNSQNGIGNNTPSTGFLGNLAGFAGSALGNAITSYHNQHSHGVTSQMGQKPPNNNISPNNLNNYQSTQQLYNAQSNVDSQLFNRNPINLPTYLSLGSQGAIDFNTGSFTNNNGFSPRPNPFYYNSRPTDFQNSGYFGPLNNNVGPDSENQGWFTNRWPGNRPNLSNDKIVSANYIVRPPNTNYIGPRPQVGGVQNSKPSDYQTMTNEGFNGVSSQENIVNSIGSLLNLNKVGVGLIDQNQENSLNRIIIAHHGIRKAPFYAGLIYIRPLEVSNALQTTNALLAAAGGYNAGFIPVIIGMGGDGTATVLDNIKFPSSTNAMVTSQGNHLGYEINSNQRPNNNLVNYNAQYNSNLGSTTNSFLNSQTQGGFTQSDKLPNINSQVQIGGPSSNINSLINGMKFPQGANAQTLINEGALQTFTNNIQPSNNNFSTNSQSNANTFLQGGNIMSNSNHFNALNGNLLIQPQKHEDSISNNQQANTNPFSQGTFNNNNLQNINTPSQGGNFMNTLNNANTNSYSQGNNLMGSFNHGNSQSYANAFTQGGNIANQYSSGNTGHSSSELFHNANGQSITNTFPQGNGYLNQLNNANTQSNANSQGGGSASLLSGSFSGTNSGDSSSATVNNANSANLLSLGNNFLNQYTHTNSFTQGGISTGSINSANAQSNPNAILQGGNLNQYSGANAQSNANSLSQINSVGSLNNANSLPNVNTNSQLYTNSVSQGNNFINQFNNANAQSNTNALMQGGSSIDSINSANSQSNPNAFSQGGNLNQYNGANAQSNANAYLQGNNLVGSMNSANSQYNANIFPTGGYAINQYGIANSGGSSSNTLSNANSPSNANTMSQGNNGLLQAQFQASLLKPNITGPTNKPLLSVNVPLLSASIMNPFQKKVNVKKSDIEIAKESGEALAGAFKSFLNDNVLY